MGLISLQFTNKAVDKNLCRARIRTQGQYVRSTNATSVLCSPLRKTCRVWIRSLIYYYLIAPAYFCCHTIKSCHILCVWDRQNGNSNFKNAKDVLSHTCTHTKNPVPVFIEALVPLASWNKQRPHGHRTVGKAARCHRVPSQTQPRA